MTTYPSIEDRLNYYNRVTGLNSDIEMKKNLLNKELDFLERKDIYDHQREESEALVDEYKRQIRELEIVRNDVIIEIVEDVLLLRQDKNEISNVQIQRPEPESPSQIITVSFTEPVESWGEMDRIQRFALPSFTIYDGFPDIPLLIRQPDPPYYSYIRHLIWEMGIMTRERLDEIEGDSPLFFEIMKEVLYLNTIDSYLSHDFVNDEIIKEKTRLELKGDEISSFSPTNIMINDDVFFLREDGNFLHVDRKDYPIPEELERKVSNLLNLSRLRNNFWDPLADPYLANMYTRYLRIREEQTSVLDDFGLIRDLRNIIDKF